MWDREIHSPSKGHSPSSEVRSLNESGRVNQIPFGKYIPGQRLETQVVKRIFLFDNTRVCFNVDGRRPNDVTGKSIPM